MFFLNYSMVEVSRYSILFLDGWKKEDKKFCRYCTSTYDTMEEAKLALQKDQGMPKVIYDLFCDGVGYFCICPLESVIVQTHPRGIDCIYVKKDEEFTTARSDEL